MKKLSLFMMAGLMILAGSFTSCDKIADEIQDATEVTINTTLDIPIVAVPESTKSTDENATFSETATIDLSTNDDIKDYLDKIQSVEVTKIVVNILSSDPLNLTLIDGAFRVRDNVTGDAFSTSTLPNMPIAVGSSFEVGPSTPGWETINKIIASRNSATLSAYGTINNSTFSVGFEYIIHVKVVAKP